MSHPWKAQPYYLYHDPRTTGTVPAPMGAYVQGLGGLRVQEALGNFTRGSFASKSPWNVLGYVAKEPTGVDGFGRYLGFGQDADCVPFESIQGWIKTKADALVKGLPATGISIFDNGKTMLTAPIATLLTKLIREAAEKGQNIESYVQKGIYSALKGAICSIPGACGIAGVGGINLDGVLNVVVPYIQNELFDIPNVCPPTPSAPGTTDPCLTVPLLPVEQQAFARKAWGCNGVVSRPDINITGTLPQKTAGPSAYSKLLLSSVSMKPGVPVTAPAVAPAAGGNTAMLVGAAALAALLLLR